MSKKIIINADGLGISIAHNKGVLEGYSGEILRSVSLSAGGEAFDDAVENVLPQCPSLSLGVHLNLFNGKSLQDNHSMLADQDGNFCISFWDILYKTYSAKNNAFLNQIEEEFRAQIEKVKKIADVLHIDSEGSIHLIPKIFSIVCRLAEEYKIPYVRSEYEKLFFVPDILRHFDKQYFKNFIRTFILNLVTVSNETTLNKYQLRTNDYIIGNLYRAMLDSLVIYYGISSIEYDNSVIEICVNPCRYEDGTVNSNFNEYMILKNKKLKDNLEKQGYRIVNYREI